MRRSITWGAAVAVGLAGALGAVRLGRESRRAPSPNRDSEVSARVWFSLCSKFGPKAEDFSITVHEGNVTLRGDVATLDDIRRLGAEIELIEGVASVVNLLRLHPSRRVLHGEPSEAGVWLS